MRSKKGSIVIIVGLVILAIILVGVMVYKLMPGSNYSGNNYSQSQSTSKKEELTKTDEISDIEKDLNSTNTENLDSDVLGITSQVE